VQELREPAVGRAFRPGLDYLARWGAGGRAASQRILQRGVTATGVPLRPDKATQPEPPEQHADTTDEHTGH
jgi:hypothetical protein